MKIEIFPHTTENEDTRLNWHKTFEFACLPPIGASFVIDDDPARPVAGHVSRHGFNPDGTIEVYVELVSALSEEELEEYLTTHDGWKTLD